MSVALSSHRGTVAKENWPGFRVESLRVKKREDTGVGRYVHFEDLSEQVLVDGSYGSQERAVQMQGVRNGLYFVIEVSLLGAELTS